MGTNQWRDQDEWALARAHNIRYFLHSGGKTNSALRGGALTSTTPGAEGLDKYLYDPAKPVQPIGGPLCCDAEHLAAGAMDQATLESRSDVLVYSTRPLTQD